MFNDIGTSGAELIAEALHVSICLGDLGNGISFDIFAFDDQYWLCCQDQSWLKGASVFAPFSMLLWHRDCLVSQGTLQKSDFTQEKSCTVLPLTLNFLEKDVIVYKKAQLLQLGFSVLCYRIYNAIILFLLFFHKKIKLNLPVL